MGSKTVLSLRHKKHERENREGMPENRDRRDAHLLQCGTPRHSEDLDENYRRIKQNGYNQHLRYGEILRQRKFVRHNVHTEQESWYQ